MRRIILGASCVMLFASAWLWVRSHFLQETIGYTAADGAYWEIRTYPARIGFFKGDMPTGPVLSNAPLAWYTKWTPQPARDPDPELTGIDKGQGIRLVGFIFAPNVGARQWNRKYHESFFAVPLFFLLCLSAVIPF